MSIGFPVASSLGLQTYGISARNKFLNADFKSIKSCLISNCGKFAIIKIRIINFLLNTYVFERVAVTKPIGHEKVSIFGL